MMYQSSRTSVLVVQTPEGISFPLLLAGPITRFLAWFIDAACIATGAMISRFVFMLLGLVSADFANALFVISFFIISIGYPIFTEWRWRGQTVGKRLFRLRVMDVQGLRLQFSQIVIRNLLRFIDSLPLFYTVGGAICFFSKKAQRLGDFAANTIVVRDPHLAEPDLRQALAGKYNSFRDYPHLAARLRQRLSVAEAGVALQAILRRESLDPAARVLLFQQIVEYLKHTVEFPEEAIEGLTDEQYVRNVIDLVFQQRR